MRAVIGWNNAIREGRVLLRDVIDLDATIAAGPTPEAVAAIAADAEAVARVYDCEVAAVAVAMEAVESGSPAAVCTGKCRRACRAHTTRRDRASPGPR